MRGNPIGFRLLLALLFITPLSATALERLWEMRDFPAILALPAESLRTDRDWKVFLLAALHENRPEVALEHRDRWPQKPEGDLLLLFSEIAFRARADSLFLHLLPRAERAYPELQDLFLAHRIQVALRRGDFPAAWVMAARMFREFPESPWTDSVMGALIAAFPDTGRLADSLKALLVTRLPKLRGSLRAEALFQIGTPDALKELVQRYPAAPQALQALERVSVSFLDRARVYYHHRKYRQAWRYLRNLRRRTTEVLYYRLMTLYQLRRYRHMALEALNRRAQLLRTSRGRHALFYAALACERLGWWTRAGELLLDIASHGGTWASRAMHELSTFMAEKRTTRWARRFYPRAKKRMQRGLSPEEMAYAGVIALLMGDTAGALGFFQKGLETQGFERSRTLFWLYRLTGKKSYRDRLREEFPLGYYTWRLGLRPEIKPGPSPLPPDTPPRRGRELLLLGYPDAALRHLQEAPRHALALADSLGYERLAIWLARFLPGAESGYLGSLRLEALYPRPYRALFQRAAEEAGLDPALLYGVAREESHFRPDAVSPAGALGVLQLLPSTGRRVAETNGQELTERTDLFRPSLNIRLGALYLRELVEQFRRLPQAIAAYNAGPGAVKRWLQTLSGLEEDLWIEVIPYRETRNYTRRVLRSYWVYHFLLEQEKGS